MKNTTALEKRNTLRALIDIASEGGKKPGDKAIAELRLIVAKGIFERNGITKLGHIGGGNECAGAGLAEAHSSELAAEIHREVVGGIGIRTRSEWTLCE